MDRIPLVYEFETQIKGSNGKWKHGGRGMMYTHRIEVQQHETVEKNSDKTLKFEKNDWISDPKETGEKKRVNGFQVWEFRKQ